MDVSFLKSNRFWALVLGAVIIYLKEKGFVGDAEVVLAETILGGFVLTRTIDRFAEKVGKSDE